MHIKQCTKIMTNKIEQMRDLKLEIESEKNKAQKAATK